MRTHGFAPALLLGLALAVALGSVSCSHSLKSQILPNQRPSVRLTFAPVDTLHEEFYVYKMNWIGYDPDGRVVRYQYVVDPPSLAGVDTPWVATTKNEQIITFSATKPESIRASQPRSRGFHVFVIRSVDNQGLYSEPVARAFYSFGVAPVVKIDAPLPSKLLSPTVTPAVQITWSGKDFIDANGVLFEKPVKYKYHLYKKGSVPWDAWLQDPDSLRRQVAPTFAGWDSTGPDSAVVQYTNLTPDNEYMFVVVAFGRSGAYSPIFSLDSNMLRMYVGFAGFLGPQITLFNSFFSFTYPSGGFPSPLDPTYAIQLQVPALHPLTLNWTAVPPSGSVMKSYRWVVDLVNLDDETARTDQNDWYHWSPWSQALTTTIGPFAGAGGDTGEVHNFYLEAVDINGLVSLGWVQFRVFKPTFDRELLIVNDTRFTPDMYARSRPASSPDSLQAPSGVWPSRAELDTFLFAVGGVRWRMTPEGTLSPRGLFTGYSFDTLGTRHGQENPTIPLSLLGEYRHIVWMTDLPGSELTSSPVSTTQPMTTLRYMSLPNKQNTLATWVGQGGKLWALGGGFGNATNNPWNNLTNDVNQTRIYTTVGQRPDLVSGRFMYDLAHWRSEFRVLGGVQIQFARLDQPDPSSSARGAWRGEPFTNPNVDYSPLPPMLLPKDPSTDPIWPYRTVGDFYVNNNNYTSNGVDAEFISLENYITEVHQSPSNPDSTYEQSTLDTLYLAYGPQYGAQMLQPGEGVNAVMTYYYGTESAPLVFSGHGIWHFRRSDCQALVDFVLGRLWGLSRTNLLVRAPAHAFTRPTATVAPRPVQAPQGASTRRPLGISTFQRLR